MSTTTHRPASLLVLKLLALFVVCLVAYFSRGLPTDQPTTANRATSWKAMGAIHPRLSPSGKDIVFSYQGAIWRLPIEGGTMKRLATGPGFAFEPCWSPDGRLVAFWQGKSWGGGLVKVIDARTGESIPLPKMVQATGKLSFGSDGAHLLGRLRQERQPEAFRSFDLKTGELKTVLRLPASRQPWRPP